MTTRTAEEVCARLLTLARSATNSDSSFQSEFFEFVREYAEQFKKEHEFQLANLASRYKLITEERVKEARGERDKAFVGMILRAKRNGRAEALAECLKIANTSLEYEWVANQIRALGGKA